MTTGYTQPDLVRLEKVMLDHAPPLPTEADLKTTPMVNAVAWNGSYTGMLLQLQFSADQTMVLHLNCVVAHELLFGLNEAAYQYNWWDEALPGAADEDQLPLFSTDHDDTALIASTLVTFSTADGTLVRFGDTQGTIIGAFLPRSISRGLVVSIATMGAAGDWWDDDFNLKPAVMVDDMVVTRAANQLVEQYGERAEIEASTRSNQALEERDQFNYELWQRVAVAVVQSRQDKSRTPDTIN